MAQDVAAKRRARPLLPAECCISHLCTCVRFGPRLRPRSSGKLATGVIATVEHLVHGMVFTHALEASTVLRIIIALVRVGCSLDVPFEGDKSLNLEASLPPSHRNNLRLGNRTIYTAIRNKFLVKHSCH